MASQNPFFSLQEQTPAFRRGQRRSRPAVISPELSTSRNAFAPLQPDTDDEESQPTSTTSINTTTAEEEDDDYGFENEHINMTSLGNLLVRLRVEERQPIVQPTVLDVQTFRCNLSNALSKIPCEELETGHASLVESEENHQLRVGDVNSTLPARLTKPTKPTLTTTNVIWRNYSSDLQIHKEYKHWDKEIIAAIEIKFPNGITDLEIDTTGMLPMYLTGRVAMDHVESKTLTHMITTAGHWKKMQSLLNRPYVPNGAGPVNYFKETLSDVHGATILADDGDISVGQIIMYANNAFLKSGHKKSSITAINKEWAMQEHVSKQGDRALHVSTRLQRFQNLYNKELKTLFDEGDQEPTHRAHHTTELTNRLNDLESRQDQTISKLEQLHENQEGILAGIQGGSGASVAGGPIPQAINTTRGSAMSETGTTAAMSELQSQVKQMALVISTLRPPGALPATPNRRKRTAWQQWSYWCWTCGVNLTHNTPKHTNRKKDGHDDHLAATRNDPQGGGVERRAHLWMKWCNPVDLSVNEQRGE